MKTHHIGPLILLLATVSAAWDFFSGHGFGASPSETNATLFASAIQQANTSRSVPFQLGSQSFNLQVNVTSLPITNASVPHTDPSAVYTLYSLIWTGDEDLNATVSAAEGLSGDQQPRLCATLPLGLFSASATNGYSADDEGDCSGALGQKCVDAVNSASFGGAVGDCTAPFIPGECRNKFGDGGLGTASVLNFSNSSQSSPLGFAYWSQAYTTGSPAESDGFSQEAQRLHMVVFADQNSYHPVCLRLSDERVRKGDPAAGGAGRMLGGVSPWASLASVALLGAALIS